MHVTERQPGDLDALRRRIRRESDAAQRDRYRVVLLAAQGQATQAIQQTTARSRGFVQRWVYTYRDGGLGAIVAGKPSGAPTKLTPQQEAQFKHRLLAGPSGSDLGVCTLRGKDVMRILQDEYGKPYSLSGVYELLHRLNLSCLKPRPRHRKQDPQAQRRWVEQAPFLSGAPNADTPASGSRSGSRTKRDSVNKAR